ncbi:MAG: sulfurtransferase [Candidatus Nanopelagicales bacterium]
MITVHDLHVLLAQDNLVLLDVRWRLQGPPGRESYAAGHLPRAVFVDLDAVLAGPAGDGGRHPLPDPADFEAAMRHAGVRSTSRVVAYDDGDLVPAARAWWLLRWSGHDAVQVLDGGYAAWTGAGLPTTQEVFDPTPGDVVVAPGAMPVVDADDAARLATEGVLVDARLPARFRGEAEPIDPVAGRIPGAVNVPAPTLLGEDRRMLAPTTLREVYANVGVSPDTSVGAYCGSGVTAAQTVLALDQLGIRAALYAGSWSHWIRDASRPVETG